MEDFGKQAVDITNLSLEVKEVDDLFWGGNERVRIFSKDNLPEYINCSNPLCHGGGISVIEIIRDTVNQGKDYAVVNKKCPGYEGSPKGRKKYKSCIHAFKVTVHIYYV